MGADQIAEAKEDKAAVKAVEALSDFVNNFSANDHHFAVLLAMEHRTLQQSATQAMLAWLRQLAYNHKIGREDGRNEAAGRAACIMLDALEKHGIKGLPLV